MSSAVILRDASCFFQIGELRFYVRIDCQQPHLLGALQHDLVVDQRAQHLQTLDGDLIVARPVGRRAELRLILFIELSVGDGPAVHHGRHVWRGRAVASAQGEKKRKARDPF
jgi:hypothetical protein